MVAMAKDTDEFIRENVPRGTASPKTRETRLPSGVQRAVSKAQESRTVVPVPGIGEARQFMSGFIGAQPDYSVMDPNYKALGSAYRTGEQTSVAADVFGALTPFATASALSKASQIPGIAELIAYHGSPHRFKKFDASKIGTGEGAQSYGHGLYFAENPKVAKEYAINLANRDLANQGRLNAHANAKRLATLAGDPKYAADDIRSVLELNPKHEQAGLLKATLEMLESGDYAKPLKTQGSLYTVDIPDEKIAQMLDWDKPLSQQKDIVKNITPESLGLTYTQLPNGNHAFVNQEGKILGNLQKGGTQESFTKNWMSDVMRGTGQDLYKMLGQGMGKSPAVSGALREAGIPGIQYLDQVSRNKPLKDIKREFLNELPENASIDEVVKLLGTGTFSPKNEAIIKELAANDWLGFDYPAQSLSTVLSPSARNYDLSPSLMRAINEAQEGGTRNFVLFPGEEQNIKMLDINGEPLEKQDGGKVTTEEFIKKNVPRGTSEVPQVDTEGRLIDENAEMRSESQRMLNRLKTAQQEGSRRGKLPPKNDDAEQVRKGIRESMRALVGMGPYDETNPTEAYRIAATPTPLAAVGMMGRKGLLGILDKAKSSTAFKGRGLDVAEAEQFSVKKLMDRLKEQGLDVDRTWLRGKKDPGRGFEKPPTYEYLEAVYETQKRPDAIELALRDAKQGRPWSYSGTLSRQSGDRDVTKYNTKGGVWLTESPTIAESYSGDRGFIIPVLTRRPEVVLDAKGEQWDDFFKTSKEFKEAQRDPNVKSIEVKNIIDFGGRSKLPFGLSDDELRELLTANNLFLKKPFADKDVVSKLTGEPFPYQDGGPVNVPRETSTSKQQLDKLAQVSQRKKA